MILDKPININFLCCACKTDKISKLGFSIHYSMDRLQKIESVLFIYRGISVEARRRVLLYQEPESDSESYSSLREECET